MSNLKTLEINILHVDDNKDFLNLFHHIYKKRFNITSVNKCQDVFKILKEENIDVIITDYEMPDMNGLELLKKIKNEYPNMPVIFYTGQGNEELARQAFLKGAFDYHVKEIQAFAHKEKLINSVIKAIEKRNSDKELIKVQKMYRSMIKSVPLSMIVYKADEKGNLVVVNANPTAEKIFNFKRKKNKNRLMGSVIPDFSEDDFIKQCKNVAISGEPWNTKKEIYLGNKLTGIFEIFVFQISYNNIGILLIDRTQQIKMQQKIYQSEERTRFTLEHVPLGLITVNLDGKSRSVNKAYCKMMGFTPEEFKKTHYKEFVHPDEYDQIKKDYQDLIAGKYESYTRERRYIHKDGRIINAIVSFGMVRDEKGTPLFSVAIVEDITERKKAQQKLKESEERYRALIETSPDGIALYNYNGNIIFINNKGAKILGYNSPKELIGKNIFSGDIVHKNDIKRAKETLLKRVLDNTIEASEYNLKYNLIRKDGKLIPIETNASFFLDDEGKIKNILSIFRDITDRKKSQQKLKKSEELYRTLFESSPQMVGLMDLQGKMIMTNLKGIEMLHYKNYDEVIGKSAYSFLIPKDSKKAKKNIEKIINNKETQIHEYTAQTKNGIKFTVEVTISPIKDITGKIESILFIAKNIEEKKIAENKLKKSEELYRTLFETSPDGVALIDLKLRFITMNKTGIKMLGYQNENEIINQHISKFIIPDEIAKMKENSKAVVNKNISKINEYTAIKKDGSLFPIEVISSTLKKNDNSPDKIISFIRDITEKKEKEKRIELIIKSSNQATFDWDIKKDIIIVNDTFSQLTEMKATDNKCTSKDVKKNTHPDDKIKALKNLKEHFEGKTKYFKVQIRFKKETNHYKWLEIKGKVVKRDKNNNPLRMTGVINDIDKEKRYEIMIEEKNKILEECSIKVNKDLKNITQTITNTLFKSKKKQEN